MAKVTKVYDLPARRVIHTICPKYAVKYHTAAENALSHCYRLKLPSDVDDENGETIIDECKIRIKPLPKKNLPKPPQAPVDLPVSDVGLVRRSVTVSIRSSLHLKAKLRAVFE